MREFAVYTIARIGLFVATLLVALGAFRAVGVTGLLPPLLAAAALSAIASYFLLQGPRERFAAKVSERAGNASRRFEESRAKEDTD